MKNNIVEYKKLQVGDDLIFHELVLLFNREFESGDYVNSKNIKHLLNNPHFVCFVASVDNKIVGGLTAYELEMYDQEGSSMYIYDLAVSKEYQRNGIGSMLIHKIIDFCKSKSIRDVFVQVDGDDQHAIQFYKKNGGEQSKTFHFSFHTFDY
ncbi:GNAT family N-acetyltransferase [Sporosarcina sp. ACRSL]|uniref:GNAT family N-acetyltransferase n=1 Tax=Sporosarcina sp. ACRSL TaxID=2918215 RepID=UPI001EF629C0|nr:GNAT family N-acetyltransferase [Sporosarcina sp. ACRSL]MCG7345977.1 GNAT family N-acetyltransferase [Sporosarcina sp. ACRSL]